MAVIKYKDANGNYVALTNYTVQPITPVQSTGSSTTEIMSQKAVTTELNKKANSSDVYTKTEAGNTFLGKTAKASSAGSADSATKATQDASGNVITSTYATKTEVNTAKTEAKSYTDTKIANLVNGAPTTLDTLDEIAAALKDNAGIVDVLNQSIGSKQNTISDLETIRTGAAKGATALQSYTETDPVFSASAAAGIKSSDISNWNSKTSNTGTITGIKMNGASKGTSGVVDLGTVITSHQDISGKLDATTAASTYATKAAVTTTANGLMISTDKAWLDFMNGSTTSTSADSVPVTKHMCVLTISANASFAMASTPAAGREIHVIVKNSSSSDRTLTLPNNATYVNMSGGSITIPASSYGEVNVISDGSKMYLRAI